MTALAPLPKDHPIMIAWEKYKASDQYANAFQWAQNVDHRDGSMWNAFLAGYDASYTNRLSPAPVGVTDEMVEIVAKKVANDKVGRLRAENDRLRIERITAERDAADYMKRLNKAAGKISIAENVIAELEKALRPFETCTGRYPRQGPRGEDMSMREKAARAVQAASLHYWDEEMGLGAAAIIADAVLDALMEPTGNMLEAGWIAASDYEDRNPHEGFSIPDNDPISMFVFRAMIQAAKEGK